MASLQDLLAEEGFHGRSSRKPTKPKARNVPEESVTLPIYICHDRKSIDFSRHGSEKAFQRNGSSVFSSRGVDSKSARAKSKSRVSEDIRREEPAIDEVAIRAVISILGGYVGRFVKDGQFRRRIREAWSSCLVRKKNSEDVVLANLELGIESIERLAEKPETTKESKMRSLRNSIRLLGIVASLNSSSLKNGFTCGIPNTHLSACAQLYLSIAYKLEKNDRISAKHLLQVFIVSPSLARQDVLPDLWEHFFLPHLLHLKVWYTKELEYISSSNSDKDRLQGKIKVLRKVYNDKMDMGTVQFAHYYKEWLKVGVKAPAVPSVSLPSRPSYGPSKKISVSFSSGTSINKNLYRTIFGPSFKWQWLECEEKDADFLCEDGRDGPFIDTGGLVTEQGADTETEFGNFDHRNNGSYQMPPTRIHENPSAEEMSKDHKSDLCVFLPCRSEPITEVACQSYIPRTEVAAKESNTHVSVVNLGNALNTICNSESLYDCEIAIRMVAKAWLDSHGDAIVETALSKESVIEGLLEVLYSSDDDEILELAISILAELVVRNDLNRQIILNSDPQLDIFMRLLRSRGLFLKSAVLLYLLKPKAKQMLSPDWVPLVLSVLEFGGPLQTMFSIQCNPQVAAFYFLHQLMAGFDVDRNVENARQVILLGGLRLLIKWLELGDTQERNTAASLLVSCIEADGSCRHYLANNIKKASILELLLCSQRNSSGQALSLLTELVSLNRRTLINKFLSGLKLEGCLNAMHILFAYLQHAPIEQRPLVAAILLQLDLLGDPLKCSVYREEVIDVITTALNCSAHNEEVQQQSSRALLLLGSRFSYVGEASGETWLLKQAGLDGNFADSFSSKEIVPNNTIQLVEEEKATEEWLKNTATVLLTSGHKRFLSALSKPIADGTPCLVRACLVTVAWMSNSLTSIQNSNFRLMACSLLAPSLLESLNYDRAIEERVLASLSLLSFAKNSDCLSVLSPLNKELMSRLRNLTGVTWTAEELMSITARNSPFAGEY